MADGPRTGVEYEQESGIADPADWNHLVKGYDFGLLRVLVQNLLGQGIATCETNPLQINETTKRFTAPGVGEKVIGCLAGQFIHMDSSMEVSGVADSGTTTTLIDASLGQADAFWLGAYITFTSGANDGQIREITGFNAVNHTLSWDTPLGTAVGAADTYTVSFYHIQGLTNGSLNYVYGRAITRTPYDKVIEWVANTTGAKATGDIYVATITLDGSGVATASDNNPTDADRILYKNVGGHDVITLTGTLSSMPASGSTEVTRSHSYLLFRGGIRFTLPTDFTVEVNEHWKPDEVKFTITNGSSYTADCAYTCYVEGRKRAYV